MISLPAQRASLFLLLLIALSPGCDQGLNPSVNPPGIGAITGILRYQHWPTDSLYNLRFLAFRVRPTTQSDVVQSAITGSAVVYPPVNDLSNHLPYNVDSVSYSTPAPAGVYQYVVVAQQFGPDIQRDWRVVGQYVHAPDSIHAAAIDVPAGGATANVDIDVDFTSLPPQPF